MNREVMEDSTKAVSSEREKVSDDEKRKLENENGLVGLELGGPVEKALIRKLDVHLIPMIMVLYLFSFLDRYFPSHRFTEYPF